MKISVSIKFVYYEFLVELMWFVKHVFLKQTTSQMLFWNIEAILYVNMWSLTPHVQDSQTHWATNTCQVSHWLIMSNLFPYAQVPLKNIMSTYYQTREYLNWLRTQIFTQINKLSQLIKYSSNPCKAMFSHYSTADNISWTLSLTNS